FRLRQVFWFFAGHGKKSGQREYMKKIFLASLVCTFLAGGCASTGRLQKIESVSERSEKMLRDTEQRIHNLEQDVSALGSQVRHLNNRTYEVRTGGGRRTGMKVTPVDARTDVPMPQKASVEQSNSVVPVTAPILTPSVAPLPVPSDSKDFTPAKSSAAGPKANTPEKSGKKPDKNSPASKQQKIAGPSGTLGETAPDLTPVALPPAEAPSIHSPSATPPLTPEQKTVNTRTTSPPTPMPAQSAPPAAAGNSTIPVPSLPPSDLPLPPEHPDLPPAAMPVREPSAASTMPRAPEPSAISNSAAGEVRATDTVKPSPKAGQGEEAAYKAALNLARSGRSAEGIAKFRSFLQQYPSGRYAANAEYWIGECLYAQRNYKDALVQFQLVNTQYAAHHKNADALLKAGMTLNRLGDKQGAVEKYRMLLAAFPNSEAAGRARDLGLAR
ncbi:MAG: tol-pal system protein YbgF, partial [Desulfovibrio sp.]|nr:tol-pal system protein YbgF [Desulfovibrio sp.]